MTNPCTHDRALMPSVDYPGKFYCRGCEKRFTLTEWLPQRQEGEIPRVESRSFRECPDCGSMISKDAIHRPCPGRKPGIDVVQVMAPRPSNTNVACPECRNTHGWPVCQDDEREWRSEVLHCLEELFQATDNKPGMFGMKRWRDMTPVFEQLRSRFLRDETTR